LSSKRTQIWFYALAAFVVAPLIAPTILRAQEKAPWKIVSWASAVGPQAASFDFLAGLQSFLTFINANGGLAERKFSLRTLEVDDGHPDFARNLDSLIIQGQPDLVVGGSSQNRGPATAEYFRRVARPWFGPWTDNPGVYGGGDDDPVGLLPSAPVELNLLLEWAKDRVPAGRAIYFILEDGPEAQTQGALARARARALELNLAVISLEIGFRDWEGLAARLPDPGAVIVWTNLGPAAAIRRALAHSLPDGVFWMTHSLNAPSAEMVALTAGRWAGTIFPAVLRPTAEISEAYGVVLRKFSPAGVKENYRTLLGFGQGQLLARAIVDATSKSQGRAGDILRSFRELSPAGTVVSGVSLPSAPMDPGGAYLAQVDARGGWAPLP
jgi:hypothetical protein